MTYVSSHITYRNLCIRLLSRSPISINHFLVFITIAINLKTVAPPMQRKLFRVWRMRVSPIESIADTSLKTKNEERTLVEQLLIIPQPYMQTSDFDLFWKTYMIHRNEVINSTHELSSSLTSPYGLIFPELTRNFITYWIRLNFCNFFSI